MELVTPDIGLIFWQSATFLIVLAVLATYVWKPILSSLKTRENSIDEALKAAELAKEEMKQIHTDNEFFLKEARIERDQIIKKAKVEASSIVDKAKNETSEITHKMIEEAKNTIATEKNNAMSEMKTFVASFSLEIAEKILREKLSDQKKQKEFVDKLLEEIKLN